ncbi:hypothetical protein [Bounagaea algeriensis]
MSRNGTAASHHVSTLAATLARWAAPLSTWDERHTGFPGQGFAEGSRRRYASADGR